MRTSSQLQHAPEPTRLRLRCRLAILGAVIAALVVACGETDGGPECGAGTREEGGACVALCERGTSPDPTTGACVPDCVPGTHQDDATGACVPDSALCVSGEVWDEATGVCVEAATYCGEGSVWIASERQCVRRAELPVPDQVEGDGANDFVIGDRTCESLVLPEIGARWTVGGTIDPPEGAFAQPDLDCWWFTTDGPTVLRITADGVGGAAAAFKVLRDDGDYVYVERIGVGTTGAAVTRDVFLPRATRYALVTTDALHILPMGGGIARGSEDFGYAVTIERLPLPTPQRIEGTGVVAQGLWTNELPEGRTHLGFYSLPVESMSLAHVGLHVSDKTVAQTLVGVYASGAAFEADYRHQPSAQAFVEAGEVLLVADYEYWFANEDVPYVISIEPKPMGRLDAGANALALDQPAWHAPGAMPSDYFAFDTKAGDVIRLTFHTSTGQTCFGVWNARFDAIADQTGCMTGVPPAYDGEIKFVAPRDETWVLAVTDWSRGNYGSGGGLESVPARSFTVNVGLRTRTPIDLGALETPWTSEEAVTEDEPETFFLLTPDAPGQAFHFAVGESAEFLPRPLVYGLDGPLPALVPELAPLGSSFTVRAPDGERLLLGISDLMGRPGRFAVAAAPLAVQELSVPADGTTHSTTVTLPANGAHAFHVAFDPAADLELTVTPPSEVDVAFQPAHATLEAALDARQDHAGPGEAEAVVQAVGPDGLHFRLVPADGLLFGADVTVTLDARRVALEAEVEPNDAPEDAMLLTPPARIRGGSEYRFDHDLYRLELAAPTRLDLWTRPVGASPGNHCFFQLRDESGRRIELDFEREDGFSQVVRGLTLDAGTWFLDLAPNSTSRGYVLEVRRSAP